MIYLARRFTSPNSPLPQDELDELQACIEKVNDLLRSLASEHDNDNKRQLQLHFLAMNGITVKAYIHCTQSSNENTVAVKSAETTLYKKGRLSTAGRDFIQINQVGSAVFILYNKLLAIARAEACEDELNENAVLHVDSETRRELAFNFGEFVSKSPKLINLFFGIPLYIKLQQFKGKDVNVKTFEKLYYGTLIDAEDGTIIIENKGRAQMIGMDEVCYLNVLNLK